MAADLTHLAILLARPTSLLVVDMQRDYCVPEGVIGRLGFDTGHFAGVAERLDGFLAASASRLPHRVFIRTQAPAWPRSRALREQYGRSPLARTVAANLSDWFGVRPGPDDPVVEKFRYSAFMDTTLDALLRARGTETLVIAGVTTEVCVESTVRDAFFHDYGVITLSDCTGASTPERHRVSLGVIDQFFGPVATADEVLGALRLAGDAPSPT
ncbi:MAG: cysteine hydrolase [Rhodospirillales bacterium]|nr:cysteine hydrolase [Rhodospirillales bacterium]